MKTVENKKNKILSLEMQITINRYMYESSIIDDKIYNYVSNRLEKSLLTIKRSLSDDIGMDSIIIDAAKVLN